MTIAQPAATQVRPVAITVICVLSVIGIVLSLFGLVTAAAALAVIAAWYPIYTGIIIVVNAISTYGLWIMKKWALYLYTATFILNLVIGIALAGFAAALIGSIIPLIVLAICWAYQARMSCAARPRERRAVRGTARAPSR
jgi:hypothetical protein